MTRLEVSQGHLSVHYSNFVREIFDLKNVMTLKTGLGVRQGDWKCHHWAHMTSHMTSYWRSIVTMALSRVVS